MLSLTAEEERQLSGLVDRTMTRLREWETARFEQQDDAFIPGDIKVVVPGDPEIGREFREGFLAEVRAIVGEERSYLYVSNAQDDFEKRFGNYGAEDKLVTVSVRNEQYWFVEKDGNLFRYFRSPTIHERFAHLFALKE